MDILPHRRATRLAGRRATPDRVGAIGLCVVLLAACDGQSSTGLVCAPTLGEAVSLVAVDRRTGTPLPAAGSRGAVTEGSYIDSLRPALLEGAAGINLYGGGDRAGVYVVTLEHPGYVSWERTGVVVTRGRCGVSTVALRAELEPAP